MYFVKQVHILLCLFISQGSFLPGDFFGEFIQIHPPLRLFIESFLRLLLLCQQLSQLYRVRRIRFNLTFN